ncbi:Licodione synthase [Glycine max]|uniref:Cytochrome P450 n=1 Tax=Glycine max TaxID=3847 RepID=A0A0R0HUC4_SOYBN|nr:Licodione synthase [Glycine max]
MISESLLLFLIVFISASLLKLLFERKNKRKGHLKNPPSPPTIPIIGHLHLLKPLIHHSFQDLSLRYGPLISLRIGPVKFIVASTPSLAKEFLKNNELTYSSRKMNMAINMVTYHNATFAFAPYDTYWKFMKKLSTTELLGNKTLAQFLPIRTREVHDFIQILFHKSKTQERVNLTEALLSLSTNVISQMMLSIKSSETDSQAEQARALVREVTQIFGEYNISDFLGFCKNLDLQGFKKRALDIHKRYDALLEKIISDKGCEDEDGDEKVKDFLDILLDVSEQKECEVELTRNHVKSLILCFEWKMFGSQGKNLRPIYGKSLINIDERPGLTAPRANDLIGIPVARLNPNPFRQV